jgi:single-strand DNA-binding protein
MEAVMEFERDGVALYGNVTAQPVLRTTQKGIPVSGFTVACAAELFDEEMREAGPVAERTFVRFTAWRQLAENAVKSFTRGMRVLGSGRLRLTSFERRDGETEVQWELSLRDVGPSVLFVATAALTTTDAGQA